MKKILKPIFFTLSVVVLLLTTFSCEKVIKLDLNSENPKIIIEAPINIDSTNQKITIKQTVNFDDENSGIAVITADVTISNGTTSIKFNHISNGEYEASTPLSFFGSDKSYELKVIHEGKTHIATSICPVVSIPLDSIGVYKQKTFGRYNYSVAALRNETPKGVPNWYQYQAKKNGVKINKILIDDDQNLDGVTVTRKPIFDLPEFSPDTIVNDLPKFKVEKNGVTTLADSVELELTLVNIEYKVFRYYFNLILNQGGRQSATPSNPDPLFTNGALGYFSVQKSYTKKKWINTK
ncbi:MAG: hypothetical protein ACK48V_08265 [Crocinitomicaceae bacterium]|jgi:hypothetical protein